MPSPMSKTRRWALGQKRGKCEVFGRLWSWKVRSAHRFWSFCWLHWCFRPAPPTVSSPSAPLDVPSTTSASPSLVVVSFPLTCTVLCPPTVAKPLRTSPCLPVCCNASTPPRGWRGHNIFPCQPSYIDKATILNLTRTILAKVLFYRLPQFSSN